MHNRPHARIPGALYQDTYADGAIGVFGFGKYYMDETSGVDWTTTNLQKQEDAENDSTLARHLPTIAAQVGVQRILAPSASQASGRIISTPELGTEIGFEKGLVVLRNTSLQADGCLLEPGEGFLLTAAGCAVTVGKYTNRETRAVERVVVAHTALKSILNNVGDNMLASLDCHPMDARFRVHFSISSELLTYPWDHPEYGEQNQQKCVEIAERFGLEAVPGWYNEVARREGRVSVFEMLRSQLVQQGVPHLNITSGAEIGRDYPFYTTRDEVEEHRTRRNLHLVVRYT